MKGWEEYLTVYENVANIEGIGRKLCKCKPRCTTFFEFTSINKVLCQTRAENFMYAMINQVKNAQLTKGRRSGKMGWTTEETKFVKDWVEKNGVKYGDYRKIGELLGRTREVVKSKVQYMEKIGEIVRKEEPQDAR